MTPIATVLSLIALLASLSVGQAAEAKKSTEGLTLDDYGVKTPGCREWTDQCAVCLRRNDGGFRCSLPGIACQPAVITCRDIQKPATKTIKPD